jgi:AmmeMemoRadiSam system protein B
MSFAGSIPECPRLRNVEAFPVQHEGRSFIALRDPAGYTPSVLLLPMALTEVVRRFDGRRSIVDIQAELTRQQGEIVFREPIDHLVAMLDEHGFLDSPRFAERKRELERDFREAPARPASHAGGAYPGEAATLTATMDGFFEPPAGPGPIAWSAPVAPAAVTAVIAPHIDFHRGGPAYAWAYRDVAERCDADLFVIFGTCHAGMDEPFALTCKAYETPLGAAEVDEDFVAGLVRRSPVDLFASELAHRGEHSIEFQAVFLRYLFARRRPFTIVPLLTSFAHEAMARGIAPETDPRVLAVLDGVLDTAHASRRRVAFVAGADLAHVGPRFGDPAPLTAADMARVAEEDRAMLWAVEAGDAKGFFATVASDGDRRRICGLSPIWSLLHAVRGRRGTLRHYGQTPDPECVVTFASLVF